jgi:hypothetical protein
MTDHDRHQRDGIIFDPRCPDCAAERAAAIEDGRAERHQAASRICMRALRARRRARRRGEKGKGKEA